MKDLYLALKYMTVAELRRTSREFSADAEDRSTPGWFLEAYRNEGYERVVKLTRITDEDALRIAHTMDGVIGTPANTPGLARAVTIVNEAHERELRDLRGRAFLQLRDARQVIRQVNEALGEDPHESAGEVLAHPGDSV